MNALSIRNVAFVTSNPARLADFWAAALGYPERRDDEDEVLLAPADWGFPRLCFHGSDSPRSSAGRVHVDLTAADREAEVERLKGLGAEPLWTVDVAESGTTTWTTMRDPDGNEFDVVQSPGKPAE